MLHLPPLTGRSGRWFLPLSDRSAALLAEVILSDRDTGPSTLARLAEQFVEDPALVLWIVCHPAARGTFEPRTVHGVAEWFLVRARDLLCWDGPKPAASPASGPGGQCAFGDLVGQSLELAHLAWQVGRSGAPAAQDENYFDGLVAHAAKWLAACPPALARGEPDVLPAWMVAPGRVAQASAVKQALAFQEGRMPAESLGVDVAACRLRAEVGRQRWEEAVPGAGTCLPALAARLARLRCLEEKFDESLEAAKLEAMAEFAAGAGHEINNPLAIISGRAQLLLQGETDVERRRELASIHAQVKRAHEMIADLHLFARPPKPEPQQVDLVELVDRVLDEMGAQATDRAIQFHRTGQSGPVLIEADPVQLHVALAALCRNAMEAIGQQGRVEVSVCRVERGVQVGVRDDGPGIRPEHRPHIFEPFYSARQAGRGLGLGLSKAWRIVTNHGGRIDVQSPPEGGACFVITLPQRQNRA